MHHTQFKTSIEAQCNIKCRVFFISFFHSTTDQTLHCCTKMHCMLSDIDRENYRFLRNTHFIKLYRSFCSREPKRDVIIFYSKTLLCNGADGKIHYCTNISLRHSELSLAVLMHKFYPLFQLRFEFFSCATLNKVQESLSTRRSI